jgi:L-seryl-tRNA(Ser) seleniumtransferase
VARCEHIAARVAKIPGVTATVRREPGPSLSNRSPGLAIRWSTAALGITGPEISELLYNTEPRIALNAAGAQNDGPGDTGISLTTSMMASGDEKIVAERVVRVLSERRAPKQAARLEPPVTNLSGRWTVAIEYTAGRTSHTLHLQQEGSNLTGTHQGDFVARDIAGTITGSSVSLASIVTEEHGFALTYRFTGSLTGDTISGTLNLGEYRSARWTARRHVFTPRSAR